MKRVTPSLSVSSFFKNLWWLGVLTWAFPVWGKPSADTVDRETILQDLREVRFVEASFTETKTLHLLSSPLVSRGQIIFSPLQGIYRKTQDPLLVEMILNRREWIQRDADGEVTRLALRHLPAARVFVEILLSLFNGDDRHWKKHFDTRWTGQRGAWTIEFVAKKESPVAQGIKKIILEGGGPRLIQVTLLEKNGDQTVTHYSTTRLWGKNDTGPLPVFPDLSLTP